MLCLVLFTWCYVLATNVLHYMYYLLAATAAAFHQRESRSSSTSCLKPRLRPRGEDRLVQFWRSVCFDLDKHQTRELSTYNIGQANHHHTCANTRTNPAKMVLFDEDPVTVRAEINTTNTAPTN